MKIFALVVAAFLIGFALGGWPPRTDLYELQGRLAELQAEKAGAAYDGNPSLSGITRMLNVPEQMDPEPAPADPAPEADSGEPGADESESVEVATAGEPEPESPPEPQDFRGHIEQAADLWGMRSDLARQGFLDTIAASEDQALRFDVVMEAMNIRLEASITHWAEVLDEDSMPPTEAGIRMMKDITESLAIAYDDLDRSLPPTWKRDADESFQIVDYIDPLVALPLAEVEDKLDF